MHRRPLSTVALLAASFLAAPMIAQAETAKPEGISQMSLAASTLSTGAKMTADASTFALKKMRLERLHESDAGYAYAFLTASPYLAKPTKKLLTADVNPVAMGAKMTLVGASEATMAANSPNFKLAGVNAKNGAFVDNKYVSSATARTPSLQGMPYAIAA